MIFFRFDRGTGRVEAIAEAESQKPLSSISKKELIKRVASDLGLPVADVSLVVTNLIATMTSNLKAGHPIVLSGFGRFKPRKARSGQYRNPRTGKSLKMIGRRSITFRPSATLKDKLA